MRRAQTQREQPPKEPEQDPLTHQLALLLTRFLTPEGLQAQLAMHRPGPDGRCRTCKGGGISSGGSHGCTTGHALQLVRK
jgi:hypothetical protein